MVWAGVLLIVASLLSPANALAQTSTKPSTKSDTKPTTPVRRQATPPPSKPPSAPAIGEPLSPDVERLTVGYVGDSIQEVVKLFRVPPKGEFETTAQYKTRLSASRPTRTYSFWLDRPLLRRYDADNQLLRIEATSGCSYIGFEANCDRPSLLVKTVRTDGQSSLGSNAFGASVRIEHLSRDHFGILLSKPPMSFVFFISMPPEQASVLKESVDMLVTVGIPPDAATPVYLEGFNHSAATFQSPLETTDTYSYLALPVISTWLANRTNGQIFHKHTVTP